MKIPPSRPFTTLTRPFEVALLVVYLRERSRLEPGYLGQFLDYMSWLVLEERMEENFPKVQCLHALEQAEAVLADIRKNGDLCE